MIDERPLTVVERKPDTSQPIQLRAWHHGFRAGQAEGIAQGRREGVAVGRHDARGGRLVALLIGAASGAVAVLAASWWLA